MKLPPILGKSAHIAGAVLPPPLAVFLVLALVRQLFLVGQLGSALSLGAERLVLSTLGMGVLLAPPLIGRPRPLVKLAALDLFLTLFFVGDIVYYREFGELPSVASLRFASQLPSVASAALALLRPSDLALVIAGPLAFAALHLIARPASRPSRKVGATWALLAVVLIGGVFATTPRLGRLRHRGNAFLAGELGLLSFHVWEATSYLGKRASRLLPDPAAEAAALARLGELARDDDGRSELWGEARGRNVIVLQLESFQAFAVGLRIGGQPVTPNLDALAAESLRFSRYFHQTSSGRTSDAQFVSTCSLYPARSGAAVFEYADNDLRCLPWVLAREGYSTIALQTMGADYWNAAAIEPKMGFQRSLKDRDFDRDEVIGYGLSDRSFFRQAAEILAGQPEPFYASLLSLTSHTPYDYPNLPRELDLGDLEGTVLGSYLHAVHYTDRAVGELVASLRERGMLDRTLLAIYGDHDGLKRWSSPQLAGLLGLAPKDELGWIRFERGIPLLIRLPGGVGAGERKAFGAQVDLAPTLAGLLGLARQGNVFLGRNLLGPETDEPRVVFADGSALGPERLFAAEANAGCHGPGGREPHAACAALKQAAAADLAISSSILDGDRSAALYRPGRGGQPSAEAPTPIGSR